ncbi:NhaA family Na+:H+ antiporter [Streptomyces ambofaciens]
MTAPRTPRKAFGRLSLPERTYLADALRTETVGGVLLLVAAIAALVWANIPALRDSYESVSHFHFGPSALGLDLSVAHWAADGLLAIFFFVAGIELKRELVAGDLKDPKAAALPVVAALCGMVVPALVYTVTNTAGGGSLSGWAVPTATDIAFALAVLAVIGTSLPSALRAFLLTLAVVDDLFAILIIAVFFTDTLNFAALGGAVVGLAVFWLLLRKGVRGWYVYVPLGLVIWALMYNSGVHATIAGVAMGLMLRCHRREGEEHSPGERIEHLVRPLSAGLAVPLFALFSAGVAISGGALADVFTKPETLGVVLGLVVGKTLGIFFGTWLTSRFTRALAQRRPPVGGRVRGGDPGRHRVHRLAAHRRAGLRGRRGDDRPGQGRRPDRLARRGGPGHGAAEDPEREVPGDGRGGGARRRPQRRTGHLRGGRPRVPPARGRRLRAEGRRAPPDRRGDGVGTACRSGGRGRR